MTKLLVLLAGISNIFDSVKNLMYNLIDKGYNFLINLDWWVQAIILVLTAFLLIMGIIYFIIKSWKLVMVLIVLGGIGFLVYYFFIKKGSGASETEAIINTGKLFLNLL